MPAKKKKAVKKKVVKKKAAKKTAVKKTVKKIVKPAAKPVTEIEVGMVTHYYDHISVAVIKVSGKIKVGDMLHIKGTHTDFKQKVDSMQIEHEQITEAKRGDDIGMKVKEPVREHDVVYMA